MEAVNKSIQSAMPSMRYVLLRNSYNIVAKCVSSKTSSREITLESQSLVELELEVQNMLYWLKPSVVSLELSKNIVLAPLSTIVVGLPISAPTVVIELNTPNSGTESKPSLYITSLSLAGTEECS